MDTSKLDSMLSYVSNRDGQKGRSLFDKEVSSWLMMATELVPSASPAIQPQPSPSLTMEDNPLMPYPSTIDLNPMIKPSPLFGENPFPDNEIGDPINVRHNSIDLMALPDPVINNTNMEHVASINPYPCDTPTSTSLQSSIFDTQSTTTPSFFNASMPDDIIKSLPLPQPTSLPVKREFSESTVTPTGDDETIEDIQSVKRQKRLAKNREIAKNCRKRKKEHKAAVIEEIKQLREENDKLRQKLEKMNEHKEGEDKRCAGHASFLQRLKNYIQQNDEQSILKEIKEYYKQWSEIGAERRESAQLHLEQLKMLLLPTQMTKMCLWSLDQEDEFYDEKLNNLKYGGGIWNILTSVLNLTDEQKKSIIASRGGMLRQQNNIGSILDIVDTIQEKVKINMESMHKQMQGILDVLSPTQQAQFLIWVEEGMNGTDLVAAVKKVLQMNTKQEWFNDDASMSLSDLESLSSLSNS